PDNHWWTLWLHWETTLYVGIVPLGLVLLGVVFVRSIETGWFVVCGIVGLLIALGENSPVSLFWLLWHAPGLSFLRAPGRFSLLCVLAAAMLSGYGLHWLVDSAHKKTSLEVWLRVRSFGICMVGLTLVLVVAGVTVREWVETNSTQALALIQQQYLGLPHDLTNPVDPLLVLRGLTLSLDPAHGPSTMTLLLLGAFGLLLATWSTAPSRVHYATLAIVAMVVVDLLVFATGFHQISPASALLRPTAVAQFLANQPGDYRYFGGTNPPPGTEPNRLLGLGVPEADGYSSLTLSRVADYLKRARSGPPLLLDLLHVRYLGATGQGSSLPTFQGVQYQPGHPIASLTGAEATRSFDVGAGGQSAAELRLIGYLLNARHIPQGTVVAIAHVESSTGPGQDVPIRAGVEIADQGIELPLAAPPNHQPAQVALAEPIRTAEGAESRVLTYFAAMPLDLHPVVSRVTIQFALKEGEMDILGLGLAGSDGSVHQLTSGGNGQSGNAGSSSGPILYTDPTATVTENTSVMDRAFLVYSARTVAADSSALDALVAPGFDPRESVLLEAPVPTDLPGVRPDGGSVTLLDQSSGSVQIDVRTPQPAILVLADTNYAGWSASINGAPAPIVTADYLFRAVEVPAGEHTVQFVFSPATFKIGAVISLLALMLSAALLGIPVLRARTAR
ncbi:MAG: YfhO family protein, partial [Chloroflexi bacterium]|nr:YfhO family protein [Chloroflexota bacterium]